MTLRNIIALAILASASHGALGQAQFYPMPDLPGGTFMSRANAFAAGFVVGVSNGPNGDEAVLWDGVSTTVQGLGDLPGGPFASEALAVASNGHAVVFGYGTNADGQQEAFRWTADLGMVPLGFLPGGGTSSRVNGCSLDGSMACGDNVLAGVTEAFLWTPSGGMQGLGFLPGGTYSSAHAVSSIGGLIVGSARDASGALRPFRWTAPNGMQDLSLGSFEGVAEAVSYDGSEIVGSNLTSGQAFLWSQPTGFVELPSLPGPGPTIAMGFVAGTSGGTACFWNRPCPPRRWEGESVQDSQRAIVPEGWQLLDALGGSGECTGNGINPSGQMQGWRATLELDFVECCRVTPDFNCDGDVGTDLDIESFFACLAGNCPGCELNADVDGDGDVGTDADIWEFFIRLAGGCP